MVMSLGIHKPPALDIRLQGFVVAGGPVAAADVSKSCRQADLAKNRRQVRTWQGRGYADHALRLGRRRSHAHRMRVRNKQGNGREEAVGSDENRKSSAGVDDDDDGGIMEGIEAELGKQFGSVLWFSVLLVCLAIFGGGYVYLIFKYADFSDIPILRGPQR